MWRKALALGMMLMALGVVFGGAVEHESFIVWKITHSEKMGAVTIGGGLAMGTKLLGAIGKELIIRAGIITTLGAAAGWVLGVVTLGL